MRVHLHGLVVDFLVLKRVWRGTLRTIAQEDKQTLETLKKCDYLGAWADRLYAPQPKKKPKSAEYFAARSASYRPIITFITPES